MIGVGSYNEFLNINTLSNNVSEGLENSESCDEGLENSESCDVSLPGDNHPHWLAHMVRDILFLSMAVCVVYLSNPEIVAT